MNLIEKVLKFQSPPKFFSYSLIHKTFLSAPCYTPRIPVIFGFHTVLTILKFGYFLGFNKSSLISIHSEFSDKLVSIHCNSVMKSLSSSLEMKMGCLLLFCTT